MSWNPEGRSLHDHGRLVGDHLFHLINPEPDKLPFVHSMGKTANPD